jgi:hypothetical protein
MTDEHTRANDLCALIAKLANESISKTQWEFTDENESSISLSWTFDDAVITVVLNKEN